MKITKPRQAPIKPIPRAFNRRFLCAVILVSVFMCLASACAQGGGAAPASGSVTDVAAPGDASESAADAGQAPAPPADGDIRVTLIGDSVVLGGVDAVENAIPDIDIRARNDRQLAGPGLDMLRKEAADGALGQIVALALGTNFVTKDDIDKAMEIIGPDRQVVFVNAYRGNADYIGEVNEAISEVAAANPSNFTIADWYGYVTAHPGVKLASDDCHLTKSSAEDYANVIRGGVDIAAAKLAGGV
jgi:hypothetical protein